MAEESKASLLPEILTTHHNSNLNQEAYEMPDIEKIIESEVLVKPSEEEKGEEVVDEDYGDSAMMLQQEPSKFPTTLEQSLAVEEQKVSAAGRLGGENEGEITP